jgi:TRAP transporter TAXI family solute receptor
MTGKRSILVAIVTVVLTAAAVLITGCGKAEKTHFVSIGTGSMTGVYYPTGQAIAQMVEAKKDHYRIAVDVQSTDGSVVNTNLLLSGELDFGIVQSDVHHQAVVGEGKWKDRGANPALRAVFSIHPELLTLVATEASGIEAITDLKGKRVNIGGPGSGTASQVLDAFAAIDLAKDDVKVETLTAKEAPGLLQDGRLDAFFFTVGHPNGALKEATTGGTKVRIIPISGPQIDALVASRSYFATDVVPIDLYPVAQNSENVPTFGVKATLLTTQSVPEDIVYALTKEVFENLEGFKKLHPAYALLTKESMLDGLSAPIHAGAMRYYREAGLKE